MTGMSYATMLLKQYRQCGRISVCFTYLCKPRVMSLRSLQNIYLDDIIILFLSDREYK